MQACMCVCVWERALHHDAGSNQPWRTCNAYYIFLCALDCLVLQTRNSIKEVFPLRDCFALKRPLSDEAQLAGVNCPCMLHTHKYVPCAWGGLADDVCTFVCLCACIVRWVAMRVHSSLDHNHKRLWLKPSTAVAKIIPIPKSQRWPCSAEWCWCRAHSSLHGGPALPCVKKGTGGRAAALPCITLSTGGRAAALPCITLSTGSRAATLPCITLSTGGRAATLPCITQHSGGPALPCITQHSGGPALPCVVQCTALPCVVQCTVLPLCHTAHCAPFVSYSALCSLVSYSALRSLVSYSALCSLCVVQCTALPLCRTVHCAPLCRTVHCAPLCRTAHCAPLCRTVHCAPLCRTVHWRKHSCMTRHTHLTYGMSFPGTCSPCMRAIMQGVCLCSTLQQWTARRWRPCAQSSKRCPYLGLRSNPVLAHGRGAAFGCRRRRCWVSTVLKAVPL